MATDAGKPTTVWFTNEELAALKTETNRRGLSRSGVVREMVAEKFGLAAPTVHPAAADTDG
jgi:hypothetical protein